MDVTSVSFAPLAADFHELRHELRNRLNNASLSLALLRQQLHKGQRQDAEETLSKMEEEFAALKQLLETSRPLSEEDISSVRKRSPRN